MVLMLDIVTLWLGLVTIKSRHNLLEPTGTSFNILIIGRTLKMSDTNFFSLEPNPSNLEDGIETMEYILAKGKVMDRCRISFTSMEMENIIKTMKILTPVLQNEQEFSINFNRVDEDEAKKIAANLIDDRRTYILSQRFTVKEWQSSNDKLIGIDLKNKESILVMGYLEGNAEIVLRILPHIVSVVSSIGVSWQISKIKNHDDFIMDVKLSSLNQKKGWNLTIAQKSLHESDIIWIEEEWGLKFKYCYSF